MFANSRQFYHNLLTAQLVETALARGEGILADNGALVVINGKYTGRLPKDKFIVDQPCIHDQINWGPANQPMTPGRLRNLYGRCWLIYKRKTFYI